MRWLLAVFVGVAGCAGASDVDDTTPEDTDLEADTDTDSDTDADGDTDADTDPVDTDTEPEEPTDDPTGSWRISVVDRLPEQDPNWDDLVPGNFPEITECLARIDWIEQGLRFNTDSTITHTFLVGGPRCETGEVVSFLVERAYASSWTFDRNDGEGSVYVLDDSREWWVRMGEADGAGQINFMGIREGDHLFNMTRVP
jgi:hypothetical protein